MPSYAKLKYTFICTYLIVFVGSISSVFHLLPDSYAMSEENYSVETELLNDSCIPYSAKPKPSCSYCWVDIALNLKLANSVVAEP